MNIIKGYQLNDNKMHTNKYRHITKDNHFTKLPIPSYQNTGNILQVNLSFVYLCWFMVIIKGDKFHITVFKLSVSSTTI